MYFGSLQRDIFLIIFFLFSSMDSFLLVFMIRINHSLLSLVRENHLAYIFVFHFFVHIGNDQILISCTLFNYNLMEWVFFLNETATMSYWNNFCLQYTFQLAQEYFSIPWKKQNTCSNSWCSFLATWWTMINDNN